MHRPGRHKATLAVRQLYRPILYMLEDLMLHALGKQFGHDWLECDGAVAARVRSDSPGLLDKDCDTGLDLFAERWFGSLA